MRRASAWVVAVVVAGLMLSVSASAQTTVSRIGRVPMRPAGSQTVGPLASGTTIPVTVALAPPDPTGLASYATAVSTPGSADYHHYLSVAAFRSQFAPTDSQIAAVRSALSADGLSPSPVSANGLEVRFSASAGQLSKAFSTSFQQVTVPGGRTAYANTSAPALPSSIASTVQSVIGLSDLVTPKPAGPVAVAPVSHAAARQPRIAKADPQPCSGATADATANSALTADQLASAYDLTGLYDQGDEGAGVTIGLFETEPYLTTDITAYQACYGTDATVTNVVVGSAPATGSDNDTESTGDIEDVIGLAPQASVVVYEGSVSVDADVISLFNRMVSDDRANVISTSYGYGCNVAPADIVAAENTDLEEAAVQGQSFMTASGDDGSEGCGFTAGGSPRVDDPAGEPFITAVGGTQVTALGPPLSETTWNDNGGGSNGGVSPVATMPAYQLDASSSLNVISPQYSTGAPCGAPAGEYCRESPDVSADASGESGYAFYINGQWTAMAGTSFASPLWAALVALADGSTGCEGSDLGFINPSLYQLAGSSSYHSYFNDITTGNSDVGGLDGGLYPAGAGYDMATGLGTPIGAPLAAALCSAKVAEITIANPGEQNSAVGTPVSLTVSAADVNNTSITYSATGLPAGLTINPTSGAITGTPTTSGASTVTVVARDSDGASSQVVFGWNVAAAPSATTTPTATTTPATTITPSATPTTTSAPAPTAPAATTTAPAKISCPAASGAVTGTSLGPVKLGMTSASIQKSHAQTYKGAGSYHGSLCLTPTGINLVYAPPKLLASLTASTRKHYKGGLVFAYTTNAHYAVSGMHVGSKLTAGRRALHGGNELTVGGTSWYVALHGSVAVVLTVKHGTITRVGIAVRALNQTRAQQLRFLRDTA